MFTNRIHHFLKYRFPCVRDLHLNRFLLLLLELLFRVELLMKDEDAFHAQFILIEHKNIPRALMVEIYEGLQLKGLSAAPNQ